MTGCEGPPKRAFERHNGDPRYRAKPPQWP